MASSILTGDRRWASTRKSGMTVLGKVPKPINLPSQRLENNGLDPNVEIVPKGTLTWGSRPSSAAPNAWSSSTLLSPKTDGSTGSPSYINGRPSSGGSGTRPSTAGSDRSYEAASNAWGPNSRPSSASGLLAPNQTSIVATRPRSAETRPGSSQLSRFAENSAESTVAWGSTRIAERLGPPASKTNGFTLSSGDFPTLGSEKNSELHIQRGHNSRSRPTSASGTDAAPKERLESPLSGDARVAECSEQGTMTLKADNYLHVGDGAPPNMNWQMEPQYPSLNVTPHQFDSWRGPPLHSPDGIWYRGGGLGGPCRPTGPPGGFPADHFGYYPQFPPSSEAVPRQGAGQGGYHPNNGETYRPHVPPNSFMVASHPVLPARPGVYQAPVPYDGYHGMPQAGFCSYSEREVPFLGVASRPGVYNQHPHQNGNLNPGQFHIRPGGHDPPMAMETDHAHGTHQAQYKVLLKQHDGLEDNKLQEMEQPVACNPPHFDKGSKRGRSAQEASWCTNSIKDEQAVRGGSKPDCEGFPKPSSDLEGHSSEPVSMDSQKSSDKATDGILMRPETAVSVAHDRQGYPVTKKNATLIEKIEGLNNKARSADGHSEVAPFSFREEKTKLKAATRKADHSPKTIFSNVITMENAPSSGMVIPAPCELNPSTISNDVKLSSDWKTVPGPSESQVIAVGKSDSSELGEVGHSHNYRRDNAMRARVDYRAKSRSNSQVDDGWTKETPGRDSSVLITVTNGENGPQGGVPDGHASQEATAKESHHSINASASYTPSLDSLDYQAQRAKMKEIVAQRAKQLQKEEEERTREQKAKALAKLEELNRRSSAQSSKQKSNDAIPTSIDMQHKQDSGVDAVLKTDATNNEVPSVMLAENSDAPIQANDSNPKNIHASAELPSDIASHTSNNVTQDPAIYHDPSLALRQETNNTVVASQTMGSHIHDTSISKHKHMGYRRRQIISTEKNAGENPIASGNMESPKNLVEMAVDASINDSLHHNEDPSVQHKKKNTKNSRNKNKLDEAPTSSTTPSLAHTEEGIEKGPIDCQKTYPPASAVETVSVPAQNSSEISGTQGCRDVMPASSKQEWSKATEEARARSSNQWKPQHPRRSARNQQGIKPGDKFHGGEAVVWAPVKQQNKSEQQPEEISQSNMTDASSQSLEKKEHDIQNGMKTKRAEMERYVPKPVAKEMSQQENSRFKQGASSDKSGRPEFDSRSLDRGRHDGLAVGKTEFLADTKNGEENKPNRHGKTHASWRQRNSAESASAFRSSGEGSGSSGAKVVQNPSDSQLEKQFKSDDWDSNNDNAFPTEPVASLAGVKDEGITSRQKRQQFKVPRVAGNNHAPAGNKDLQTGIDDKSDIRTPAPDLNEPDLRNASKTENKNSGGEHMRSHWKLKSHANSHKQGNRSNGGQRVAFHSGRSDKEFASQGFESNPLQEDADALVLENGVGESHQEAKGYMKVTVDPSKQQIHTPNKDVPINAELGPENVKAQHEHQVVPSPRRHGQHDGRFNRGQEAAYRGRDSRQDAGRQNFHRHGDRRKSNSHYEYHPIGPYDKPSDSSQWSSYVGEESREGSQAQGLRFRERDQNRSRHGGQFFRRSSGAAVHVGEPYNNGD